MSDHILIVEDEEKIALLIRDYLEAEGFVTTILDRGDLVESYIAKTPVDLILLDVMLPGKDGLTLCRDIRKTSSLPVIMLTARVSEIDRLVGLELGSDDYICKPFSPREVVARVKAVLRRTSPPARETEIAIGPLALNEDRHTCTVDNKEVTLTPNEFGILRLLMAHPGKVFSRSELLDKVQGYHFEGYERTVDSHVKNLRKKLAARLPKVQLILSVYGIGYKLNDRAFDGTY
ncbi:MAG TPA: two-component system response regulator BaeR [Desulfobacteraceae bacterium]|nr:two-component system response regulator BaeR [Desulfobacteraceae bacterium]